MLLWRLLTRRMVAKLFLALGVTVGAVLIVQSRVESGREARTLKRETTESARRIANSIIGAVRHSMLSGEGIEVKQLLGQLIEHLPDAQVHVYDRRGIEVFAPPGPAPDPASLPPPLAAVLADAARVVAPDGRVFRPVAHERRCERCHEPARLRGVLAVDVAADALRARPDEILAAIVTQGFIEVMTARQSDRLDVYFDELAHPPGSGAVAGGVRAVAVYDAGGGVAFGRPVPGVTPQDVAPLLAPGSARRVLARDGARVVLTPLPLSPRCAACHRGEEPGSVRGVLAVALGGPAATDGDPPGEAADAGAADGDPAGEAADAGAADGDPAGEAAGDAATDAGADNAAAGPADAAGELERLVDTSLRYIMLSRLGRRIGDFLDAVVATGGARALALYDLEGRAFWTTEHPPPPAGLARALTGGGPQLELAGAGASERALVVEPLGNDPACVRCHGADASLLGAVSVSLSTAVAARARAASMRSKLQFTGLTLLGILVLLGSLLQYLVALPVKRIGDVADAIGHGDLSVTVARASDDGDEIARLGSRINQMVAGLRAKMHWEKFVPPGAARAAEGAGAGGVARTGQRRAVTVLFSDIRGFTALCERTPPEQVVEMLNRLLQAQAEVVVDLGGDIDKFVGDELMAVFQGERAEARAVECALRMIDAVGAARREGESLRVGIGIAAGDVVYGAIGHEDRMDFTVIGDVVNTGARLCAAAAPDEILVTTAVRDAAGDVAGAAGAAGASFGAGDPLPLKGKAEPLPVYRVKRA